MRRLLQLCLLGAFCACSSGDTPEGEHASAPIEVNAEVLQEPAAALIPPPRRQPILGVFGFTARSSIRFEAMPDAPHQLSATYAFPDRARWYIEPANAQRGQRSVRYRSGPQVWELAPGASLAAGYEGLQKTQALLQLELRRAAMIWPHGLEWRLSEDGGEAVHTASLETGGSLSARAPSAGTLPTTFTSHLDDGSVFEELREVGWTDGPLGQRPARWLLVSGGLPVWQEQIESVDTKVRFVDSHFLPPHLRALPKDSGAAPIQLVEVPARLRKRSALQAKTWSAALAEAERLLDSASPPSAGDRLDRNPVFELDAEGRPAAVILRLISRSAELPEGWELAPGESALSQLSVEGALPDLSALQALSAATPEGAIGGRARLRVTLSDGEIQRTQLLIPLSPGDLGD